MIVVDVPRVVKIENPTNTVTKKLVLFPELVKEKL